MNLNLRTVFYWSSFSILMFTALLKLVSVLVGFDELAANPHSFLPFVTHLHVTCLAIGLEIIAAFYLIGPRSGKEWVLAALSSVFFSYRVGLIAFGGDEPCGCLGNLSENPPVGSSELATWGLLAYMLVSSYYLVIKELINPAQSV